MNKPDDRSKKADPKDENAVPKNPAPALVEGVDYYLEEGLFVFTEKYHLEKGYCCNNNCRHCPYKNKT